MKTKKPLEFDWFLVNPTELQSACNIRLYVCIVDSDNVFMGLAEYDENDPMSIPNEFSSIQLLDEKPYVSRISADLYYCMQSDHCLEFLGKVSCQV